MEMQTKTMIGYYHTPIRMGKVFFFFSVTRLDAGKDAEKLDYSQFAGRNEQWCSHSKIQFGTRS